MRVPAVGDDVDADVAVVGAGAAGLYAALLLARTGASVVLVDRDELRVDAKTNSWHRPGLPQLGNGHAFHGLGRSTLLARSPDVLAEMVGNGVSERRFVDAIPDGERQPGDEALVALQSRRSVFDLSLGRAVLREPNLHVRQGVVTDALAERGAVTGIRLRDGTQVRAPWVLDAAGRRSVSTTWLRRLGVGAPTVREQAVGTWYFARHFRRRDGFTSTPEEFHFGASGDLGFLRWSVLEEDSDGFVVTVTVPARNRDMRRLGNTGAWMSLTSRTGRLAGWVDAKSASPISGICCYAHPANRIVDHTPASLIDGLVPVGDALCVSNPTQGWGVSVALHEVATVVDAVTAAGARPADSSAVVARSLAFAGPLYEAASAEDRERSRQASGLPVDVTDPETALFCRKVVYPLGAADVAVYRAAQRRIHLFDDPTRLTADQALVDRALRVWRRTKVGHVDDSRDRAAVTGI
jgi:2-polyprenyl-6-methoxyphenol hydroxylase-like FAD-dependent oxidoreductase